MQFIITLNTIKDNLIYTYKGKLFIYTNSLERKKVEMLEDFVRSRRKNKFLDPSSK